MKSISVIMPSCNEEEIIEKTVYDLTDSLSRNNISYELIIVDNGSKDGTRKIIKKLSLKNKNIRLIIIKQQSFGYALIKGTNNAKSEIIIWVMSDSSDDFETIPRMIEKINQGFDMVIASRNIKGGSRGNQSFIKAVGSKYYSFFAKIIFNLPVYDITNGFRIFRKQVFENVKLEKTDFSISPEFAIKAHLKGFKLAEVPTTYKDRQTGEAKSKLFRMGIIYFSLLFKIWVCKKINLKTVPRATLKERKRRIKNLLPYLEKEWKILDCACGDGWLVEYLNNNGFNCVGVDIDTNKYIKADARDLPFKDESFDCIISFYTLEHIKCEHELKRVLKNNGILIVEVPRWDFPFKVLEKLGLINRGNYEHIRIVDFNKLPFKLIKKKIIGWRLCKFGIFKKRRD